MIKVKTKYNFDTDIFTLGLYKTKNTCTMEHLALISKLIDMIMENSDMTRKEILNILKKSDFIQEVEYE